jgi:hypothetical protein
MRAIIHSMPHYDLCLAWNWEYDADFVRLLAATLQARGLSLLPATAADLPRVLTELASGDLTFTAFFDRASESDPRFQPLADWVQARGLFCLNPRRQAFWAADKATMHLEFISRGLDTPYTLLLPPFAGMVSIPRLDLTPLGGSFAIKPACGGGGEGVVLAATSWDQVLAARRQFPAEKYLLQAQVTPVLLDGRPAWFRVLVCDGALYPCWWDPHSHVYTRVSAGETVRFGLRSLRQVPFRIAQICGLHLFSTEMALSADGRFLVVDYVNEIVDLRPCSAAADGVPDDILQDIALRLARLIQM